MPARRGAAGMHRVREGNANGAGSHVAKRCGGLCQKELKGCLMAC